MGNCGDVGMVASKGTGPVFSIMIEVTTWPGRYPTLFDYKAEGNDTKRMRFQGSAIIAKKEDKFICLDVNSHSQTHQLKDEFICKLLCNDSYYELSPLRTQPQRLMWVVVNSLPDKKYQLQQNDTIRLANQAVKVRKLGTKAPKSTNPQTKVETLEFVQNIYDHTEPNLSLTVSAPVCKLCFDPGMDTDPLLGLCECQGSCRYVHLSCVRKWLQYRIKPVTNTYDQNFAWKKQECEVCKHALPYVVSIDDHKVKLIELPIPNNPHIILEVEQKQESRLFIIDFNTEKSLTIGKQGGRNQVSLTRDHSVSHLDQSLITYIREDGSFWFQDQDSIFGSLVLVDRSISLRPHIEPLSVQIGSKVYKFSPLRKETQDIFQNYQQCNTIISPKNSQTEERQEDQVCFY